MDIGSEILGGHLPQAELLTFVARVNPATKFTPLQLTAIVEEVISLVHVPACSPLSG